MVFQSGFHLHRSFELVYWLYLDGLRVEPCILEGEPHASLELLHRFHR
jgi:hypothetical protein